MKRKFVLLSVALVALTVLVGFSFVGSNTQSSASLTCEGHGGIVDKMQCEAFAVKIVFKNTGKTEGTWSVNIAFEGESWSWSGNPQTLTLKPCKSKTLVWNGTVPCNAAIDSVARLIVYYDDSVVPLDWWIHVTPGAELTITSSTVE